ncbi:MAG: xanthine dehydrogenase family protein subunit M [Firmicutes bacterium]|nr:xanthine dehydrogenase family protein subunit M [Alicyclobacillaceae bacterium]MCL6498246.1 xanthine dehydrogenase family protein subunit M [Bacillota bacterium]
MEPFELAVPTELDEALTQLAADGAVALAGGTATVLMLKQNLLAPRRVVYLGRIAALRPIRETQDGGLRLGATATLAELVRSELVRQRYPVLAETANQIGNPRVRAVATVGGNLLHADPNQDLPPLLLTLGATLEVATAQGVRRQQLEPAFFTDYMQTALEPGALVTAVFLPPPLPGFRAAYRKFTPRSHDDFATVGVAAAVVRDAQGRVTEARVALSGVGPTPVWVPEAAQLIGEKPGSREIAGVAEAASRRADPWDDLRGSAEYKRAMARVWTRRVLEEVLR